MRIFDLCINHRREMLGIECKDPAFSFKADEVCEFTAELSENGAVVATKQVSFKESVSFRFDTELKKNTCYRFKVSAGDTSAYIDFETEIDFDAAFITPDCKLQSSPIMVKKFKITQNIVKARLYITGLGLYRAFLNGKRVGDTYLTPGFNDYEAYLRYQTYDITDMLLNGENGIEVCMGNGWYKGWFGPRDQLFGSDYRLAARIDITYKDGTVKKIYTDETWEALESGCGEDSIENSIYNGENRDYRDISTERHGCKKTNNPYRVVTEFNAPIREKYVLKPELYRSPKGEQILDFGQNMVGIIRFKGKFPRDTKIVLKHGEVLQNGCFYNANLRSAKAQTSYISDGNERIYEPMFTFFGFRYALVEGIENVDPDDFEGVVLFSDLEETLTCTTDDPKINRLILNAIWGQRGNFLDVPTDCPQRDERKGWTADAQVFTATACYNMDCRTFYRKYQRDMREDQTRYYNGDIPMYSPMMHEFPSAGGAVWADAATIIPWVVYKHYGDKTELLKSYPMMKDYVETLIERSLGCSDGTLILGTFTFGDWLAQDGADDQSVYGGTDNDFILCSYYFYSVDIIAKTAKELGYSEDHKRYSELAGRIKTAVIERYFDENGGFSLDTQTSYVLALKFGFYRDRDELVQKFKDRLFKDGNKIKTGFTGTPLILPTLFDCGLDKEAFTILYNEEFPGWLYCVNLGATTIWERWNSLLPDGTISGTDMNSLNHYALGSVCEAIYARIAGLRPADNGWSTAVIEPHFDPRMKHIDLRYRSHYGEYRSFWKYEADGTVTLTVDVPTGCTATVILPGKADETVTSGTHTFTVRDENET